MTDYLDRLAQVAAEVRVDTLPESTVEAGKRVLLDTLGAIVAGSALPENRHLARLAAARAPHGVATRSEEHTPELQSHSELVCRLLLEKKNGPVRDSGS